jgi:hypothetical protein
MFTIFHRLLNTDFCAQNGRVLSVRAQAFALSSHTFHRFANTNFCASHQALHLASVCRLWQTPISVLQMEGFRPCKRKHPRPSFALFRSSLRLADSNPLTPSQVIV